MITKKHITPEGKLILAICDDSLIGKKFQEKNMQIDLTGKFYKGEKMPEKEIEIMIKKAYCVNMVGEESIRLGIKTGIIKKENIIKIDGVPHAEGMMITE